MLPEDVEAALVGALGELRQFSFSWFKKGQNQQKTALRGQKGPGLVWLCSEAPLGPCTPRGGSGADRSRVHGGAAPAARCFWPISTYRNQEPAAQSGKCQKGTLGLLRVRGDSGSCQRHGKRGAGGRAAASSPSQRRHSDRSQPCESLSKRWEPRWWRCHWAGSPDPHGPRGAPRGNPLPPCPRPPPSAPTSLGTGLSPGQARFPFASCRNARSEREVLV